MEKLTNLIFGHHVTPFSHKEIKKKGNGFYHKDQEFIHHSTLHHDDSAFRRFSNPQIFFIVGLLLLASISFYLNTRGTIIFLIAALTFLYFADLLFNLYLIFVSFSKDPEIRISDQEIKKIKNKDWPMYTILCPLYKEWHVLPQFITAMTNLEYPKNRLQVMLLLEENDKESIQKIRNMNLPRYFETVIVPNSKPKTKPKACNYGLTLAKGEYVVIYDAEDIPDVRQLKKTIIAFKKSNKDVVCVQAKLNFYNPHQNLLTKIFTAEYSLWFDLVLTGLQSIDAPIPLGGTSNHFKTVDLIRLKGWDSFNVTEDCDLGMRLAKEGYQTAIVDSVTLEEANSQGKNWVNQRTRWIKGYIQTYLLHMRRPQDFMKVSKKKLISFQLVVGGKVLSMLINPIMWAITILYFAFRANIGTTIESFFPGPILYMGLFSLVIGNFLYSYYYMIGSAKHGHDSLTKYVVFVPFYWLAISITAWIAMYKLIVAPHHWSKTLHGLHLNNKNGGKFNFKPSQKRIYSIGQIPEQKSV